VIDKLEMIKSPGVVRAFFMCWIQIELVMKRTLFIFSICFNLCFGRYLIEES